MKISFNTKTVVTGLATAGLVIGLSSAASAVTGNCDNCHTMHDSQAGSAMATNGPNPQLLTADGCAGCHADGGTNAADAFGGATPDGQPRIDDQTNPLAGGFFDTTADTATEWTKEHNVSDLNISQDTQFTNPLLPPGGVALSAQLQCIDCHQTGGHHANVTKTATDWNSSATAGTSYRFLSGAIHGIEDSDYQYTTGAADHNTYYGAAVAAGATATDVNTISAFCAGCHENFHAVNAGTDTHDGTSWVRHPTDYALPNSGEYAGYSTYRIDIPVASDAPNTTPSPTAGSNAVVMCLSCHMAHGSANDDILRFDYTTISAGGGASTAGCFACHTTKDV